MLDEVFVLHCCADGGFVDDCREVCAREHGCSAREFGEVDIGSEFDLLGVNFEDLESAFDIGEGDGDLAIEATWTDECWIENIGAVCCGDDDDAVSGFEAVHFDEDRIECLLAFVVSASRESPTAATAYGVDFIEEDDTGCGFFRLFKEIADAGCADTYEHFNKV